jgi:acyl-CoA synthetase (NDP forming)
VDALLHQAGVLRFRGGEELFNAAEFFERQPLPNGRRIGIVSNSLGVATLAADACATRGLEVRVAGTAPNPLFMGVGAGAGEYAAAIGDLLADPALDALMVYYVDVYDGDPDAVLTAISAASEGQLKPVVASVVRSDGRRVRPAGSGVPNFLFPESCADVLARAAERREWLSRPLGQAPQYSDCDGEAARVVVDAFLAREPAGGWLSPAEAEALLASHGVPLAASRRRAEIDPAVAVAAEIGDPVAPEADFAASGGADVLVGAVADPDLGPVLAVGLGGRHAGLDRTAEFRLLPLTDADADELIDSSESVSAELDGFGGTGLLDREALRELILRFALLLREAPEVVEADLNPVRCMTGGCVVLDMRLRIEHRRPVERVKTW